uniref:Uncharacterized protein n=1 Tax=Romanomermis culicivorax TaxID=13658 RepID=A0A915IDP4_ROMCU
MLLNNKPESGGHLSCIAKLFTTSDCMGASFFEQWPIGLLNLLEIEFPVSHVFEQTNVVPQPDEKRTFEFLAAFPRASDPCGHRVTEICISTVTFWVMYSASWTIGKGAKDSRHFNDRIFLDSEIKLYMLRTYFTCKE